jgi:hypothetical protein
MLHRIAKHSLFSLYTLVRIRMPTELEIDALPSPRFPADSPCKTGVIVLAVVLILGAAAWAAGLWKFLVAPGGLRVDFPQLEEHAPGLHNLALFRYGTVVTASSYDQWGFSQHHPGFLIDGFEGAPVEEKWATIPSDTSPWVEIRWGVPAKLDHVVIHHAGAKEEAGYTARHYKLTCLQAQGPSVSVKVTDNASAVAEHLIDCAGAIGIRLDVWPNKNGDVVRIFEVQAWGLVTAEAKQ